jgi:small-conductance mechanosensitive channel
MCRFAHLGKLQTISAKKGKMGSMLSIGLFIRRKRFIFLWAAALLAIALPCTKAQTANGLNGDAIVDHLNAAIDWYRHVWGRVPSAGLPSDAVYQFNAQNMAAVVVQLAFQSAQAEGGLLPAAAPAASNAGASAPSALAKLESDTNARITALEAEIPDLTQQIASAPRAKRQPLIAQKDNAEGELELRKTMRDTFQQLTQFISANGEGGKGGLEGQINELRHSVPELSGASAGKAVTKPPTAGGSIPSSGGLIGEVVALYDQLQAMHQLSQLMQETARVRDAANKLHNPLVATLRATIAQGQQLTSTPVATAGNGAAPPAQQKQQFEALAARFKQLASASVPLSQEIILLDQSSSNFLEWRQSILHESNGILRSIILRVFSIALAMGVILLLSEVWRRVTFRYVSDVRRRRQFLVLRRVVMGFCMGIVLILGFVSEFSSLATFAGFITAGLAVGLQTILLSVAAYFFLVGRWGIRVGDRISVASVTGDVIDIGLVRLYLMELGGTGVDLYPTGRVVVFSNSVLFQPTTPLFKQLPGSEYAWHEVSIVLNPGGKYDLIESQLLEAVRSVHAEYSDELQRQLGYTERRMDIPVRVPEPHGQLQYGDAGLEYAVRYPVDLHKASEVDEKITRKLLEMLQGLGDLQTSISGVPKIRAAVKW